MNPRTGDVIKFFKACYKHYAIYIGTDVADLESIIHWWTEDNAAEPRIQITPLESLAASLQYALEEEIMNDSGNLVVQRAIAFKQCLDDRLHEGNNYRSLFNDSMHFAKWCCNGLGNVNIELEQIRNVMDPWRFVHGSVTNTFDDLGITRDNDALLQNLNPGTIIRFCHQDYTHWALYLGEQEVVHNVIHWWDRDSVVQPSIVIDEYDTVAGHCKAEVDSYIVHASDERAALLASEFMSRVRFVPNDLFESSKQFAFWCRFGLGLSDLEHIPDMATEAHVRNFVDGLKATSDPNRITTEHNNMIEMQLRPGDVIALSQDSHQYYAVCFDVERQGTARVIRWLENDWPSIMVDLFQTAAHNKKAMLYRDRDKLGNVINWNEMVNRVNALRTRVKNDAEEDYHGLFSNSKHFALWVFDNYGPNDVQVTVPQIERVDIWQHIYGLNSSNKSQQDKVRIRQKNKRVLDALKEGDLVRFHRIKYRLITYEHYAVYIGKVEESGKLSVIHWYPDPTDYWLTRPKSSIRTDAFWTVACYDEVENGNDFQKEHRAYDGDNVVQRAKRKQDQFENHPGQREQYHLLTNNCEHLARECRYGLHESSQVQRFLDWWPFEG